VIYCIVCSIPSLQYLMPIIIPIIVVGIALLLYVLCAHCVYYVTDRHGDGCDVAQQLSLFSLSLSLFSLPPLSLSLSR